MNNNKEITLLAVGDIMLGDSPVCYGFGVETAIEKFGPIYPFQHVARELQNGDIVLGNLEVAISAFDKTKDSFDNIQFRGQPQAVLGLAEAGFNILSIATNHAMQHGRKGLEDTIAILKKHNIKFTGVEVPEKQIKNHSFIQVNGYRFCFMGYNFRPQQYFIDPPLWKKPYLELIKRDIDQVQDEVDYLVVSLHWGDEFIDYPSPQQVELAHSLIDHGVNIIIGHHPHILQGVEKYNGGVIAYSLGNFIFDMWQYRLRKSMILKCTISKTLGIDFQIIPVIINKNHQPQIIRGQSGENIKQEIEKLSKKINNGDTNLEYYNIELGKNLRRFRREIYWFYLTHLYKYSKKRLVANFMNAMRKRLVK